eukprot:4214755-Pyramimonas_sp.AAC.1
MEAHLVAPPFEGETRCPRGRGARAVGTPLGHAINGQWFPRARWQQARASQVQKLYPPGAI